MLGSLVYVAVEVRAKPLEGTIIPSSGAARDTTEPADEPASGSSHTAPRPRPRAGSVGSSITSARGSAAAAGSPAGLGAIGADSLRIPGAGRPGQPAGSGDESEPADMTGTRAGEASKLYDQREYDEAIKLSQAILAGEPDNVRVIRVLISSACASGDPALANTYYAKLTRVKDKRDMKKRCERFGTVIDDASTP